MSSEDRLECLRKLSRPGFSLESFSEAALADADVMEMALQRNWKWLSHAHVSLKSNKDFMIRAVMHNWNLLHKVIKMGVVGRGANLTNIICKAATFLERGRAINTGKTNNSSNGEVVFRKIRRHDF